MARSWRAALREYEDKTEREFADYFHKRALEWARINRERKDREERELADALRAHEQDMIERGG
jgi:hypothetical protein